MAFVEIVAKINAINESILEDLCCEYSCEDNEEFNSHLEVTKSWFERISFVNKKLYLLALLEDVRSAWTLSLLLKSIWNCRPKDSVFSISRRKVLSSYDQAPFDHNRTAVPVSILTQVMTDDRKWFVSLEPEAQALALLELVAVAGGPVLWQVLRRAQKIYDRYREYEIDNLKESVVVAETVNHGKTSQTAELAHNLKKDPLRRKNGDSLGAIKEVPNATEVTGMGKAQKKLDECMVIWNATIKLIRDSFKLEETETTFNDGTKKRIWKVDRPMPEAMETVDFLQLLPSAIGKRILALLPLAQLVEYSRVNKYWAYLIDELKAELVARQKIQTELEKLREIMLRNNESEDTLEQSGFQIDRFSSQPPSLIPSVKTKHGLPSIRASQKSGHFSFRHLREKMNKPRKYVTPKPINNMADVYERLERRGAADENIWKWCKNVSKQYNKYKKKVEDDDDDELPMGLQHFPCPTLKNEIITVPLHKPLVKDPAAIKIPVKAATFKIKLTGDIDVTKEQDSKRFSLWSKDFSSLYPVSKIATYQSPI